MTESANFVSEYADFRSSKPKGRDSLLSLR